MGACIYLVAIFGVLCLFFAIVFDDDINPEIEMITEDYVSFETAKVLKENRFESEDCFAFYNEDGELRFAQTFSDIAEFDEETSILAPTIQMAMKWLREEHNIDLCPEPHSYSPADGKMANYEVSYWQDDKYIKPYCDRSHDLYGKTWEKREDACDEVIRYCADKLL